MCTLKPTILIILITTTSLFAEYSFDFNCLDDTIQQGCDSIVFHFRLENTGTLPDSYAFDCRVIDSVPDWYEMFYVGDSYAEPGVILYDYLDVAEVDTAIRISVYSTTGIAVEILNLHVQSVGDLILQDSINVYAWGVDAIEEAKKQCLDREFLTACPSPFREKTDIRFQILDDSNTKMAIYDITGRLVKDFNLQSAIPNVQSTFSWDGTDDYGHRLPVGVYFVRFKARDLQVADKILIVDIEGEGECSAGFYARKV